MRKVEVLALALLLLVALQVACSDGSGAGDVTSTGPIEDGLPPGFPEDFPLYPDLEVVRSIPLGQRYIIEASSDDLPADVGAEYPRVLVAVDTARACRDYPKQPCPEDSSP